MKSSRTRTAQGGRRFRVVASLAILLVAIALVVPAAALGMTDPGSGQSQSGGGLGPASLTVDNGGFSWGDAAIGAGVALVLVALVGTAIGVQRHRHVPSPAAQSH